MTVTTDPLEISN